MIRAFVRCAFDDQCNLIVRTVLEIFIVFMGVIWLRALCGLISAGRKIGRR